MWRRLIVRADFSATPRHGQPLLKFGAQAHQAVQHALLGIYRIAQVVQRGFHVCQFDFDIRQAFLHRSNSVAVHPADGIVRTVLIVVRWRRAVIPARLMLTLQPDDKGNCCQPSALEETRMETDKKAALQLDRRRLLGAAAAAAIGVAAPPLRAATGLNLDLDDPWDRLTALAKFRGSLDGKTVMWWMKGTRFGVVDTVVTPLFNMMIGSFMRLRPVPGKGFEVTMLEMSYFTDLETGAVLDTFRNPYNGKLCQVPEQRLGPYPVLMTPTGVILPDIPMFGTVEVTTRLGPAIVQGDDVWIRDDATARVDSTHPMMGKHVYNELLTYRGKLSDLNNPELQSAPAEISFQSLTSWREWFQADDVGGHTTARASGTKIHRMEDFPPDYLKAARARHGKIMADPEAALDAPPPVPEGHG